MLSLLMCRLFAAVVGVFVVEVETSSPCTDRYSSWVTDRSVFIRNDEPKHMQGLHVVCLWKSQGKFMIEAYKNAVEDELMRKHLEKSAFQSWKEFRKELKAALGFTLRHKWGHLSLRQPFGVYSESGKRMSKPSEVLAAGLVLVFEGGQWFWPPIRKGYVRQLPGTDFRLETLSVQPVVYKVQGFLKHEECDEIIKLGDGHMFESPVSLMDKDKGKAAKEFRTSTQARVSTSRSTTLQKIDHRVANLTRIPNTHNEEVQILRYKETQYYSAHLDNWDPAFYSSGETAFMEHGWRNRVITVFWYLTSVNEGGETLFPRTDGLPQPHDMYSCEQGMKVKPERGAVIFWYSLHPNGATNPNGLHSACPVKKGSKWAANYWVWTKPRNNDAMPDVGVDDPEVPGVEKHSFIQPRSQPTQQLQAVFENKLPDKALHLFWVNADTKQEVPMMELRPSTRESMNTFPGHKFTVRTGRNIVDKLVRQFVMTSEDHQHYVINSEDQPELFEL